MADRVIWDDAAAGRDPRSARFVRRKAVADIEEQLRRSGATQGMMLTRPVGVGGPSVSYEFKTLSQVREYVEVERPQPVALRIVERDGALDVDFYHPDDPDDPFSYEVRFTGAADFAPLRRAIDRGEEERVAALLSEAWDRASAPKLSPPPVLGRIPDESSRSSEAKANESKAPRANERPAAKANRRNGMENEKTQDAGQGKAKWPNVRFPNRSVTKIEPLTDREGRQVNDRNGNPRFEATVVIPDGTRMNGVDLGGWFFKAPVGEWAVQDNVNGRDVKIGFNPSRELQLFRYEGKGEDAHRVAGAPVIQPENLWKLCHAVAEVRREKPAERAEAPRENNPSLSSQQARFTAAAEAEREQGQDRGQEQEH